MRKTKKIPLTERMISQAELVKLASDLKSEGENPEYDRALVELVTDALGYSMDGKLAVARLLRVKKFKP